eukprot:3405284-Alexandrium_andersonii.AAC.1
MEPPAASWRQWWAGCQRPPEAAALRSRRPPWPAPGGVARLLERLGVEGHRCARRLRTLLPVAQLPLPLVDPLRARFRRRCRRLAAEGWLRRQRRHLSWAELAPRLSWRGRTW